MRSKSFFGLHSLQGLISLALLCCACSSDGPESGTASLVARFPAASNPASSGSDEAAGTADSPTDSAGSSTPGSTPASAMPNTPTSESPATPQLAEPSPPAGSNASGESPAGGTDPESPAAGGEMANGGAPAGNPEPSARCGSGGASPSFSLPNTLFSVPASYDGVTPLPVVIAFHAAGNPNTQLQGILGGTLAGQYIVFYPKSDGNGWSNAADAPKVDAIFAALDATACYDKHRVFATGHSSGAQFIVQRLCAGESRWRAVATVASSVYCSSWQPIPALVIHGIGDTERQAYGLDDGEGLKDIVPYRTSNGCKETYTEVPVQGCNSSGVQVAPGCRDFDGCSETTRWCQHNDPQYGTSHHGVPCFGARVIKSFLDTFQ